MSLVIRRLKMSTIADLTRLRSQIQMDPPYQRGGEIWPRSRQQLLIDSILNGYDIPKIYFRSLVPAAEIGGHRIRFAVIDGRQRLEALWGFLDGDLTLSQDAEIEGLQISGEDMGRTTFEALAAAWPKVADRFLKYSLDVVTVETDDLEIIEDMFLRLNEATPLNAAEKRNAYGGPIPPVCRGVSSSHRFFTSRLPYDNKRYRHFDIVTKFLYFEDKNGVADTKKSYLDRFVRGAVGYADQVPVWEAAVVSVLDAMSSVFHDKDDLLAAVGMSSVYYLVFRQALADAWIGDVSRDTFVEFERKRTANRVAARDDEADADYDLLEFDRFAQSPNDAVALRFRRNVVLQHLGHALEPSGED